MEHGTHFPTDLRVLTLVRQLSGYSHACLRFLTKLVTFWTVNQNGTGNIQTIAGDLSRLPPLAGLEAC
jgi:hypothetical protein